MKKHVITLSITLMLKTIAFAQKTELRNVEKAIKNKQFTEAIELINQVEPNIENSDKKIKAKYYYLKAIATYGDDLNSDNFEPTLNAIKELEIFEQESGSKKYSKKIQELINKIETKISAQVNDDLFKAQETKDLEDYNKAANSFYNLYLLNPKDTLNLYNAALLYSTGEDTASSNKLYLMLLDLNYTGIGKKYEATSILSGNKESFPSEEAMEIAVKLGTHKDPLIEHEGSKRSNILRNLIKSYEDQGKYDKALDLVQQARKDEPDNYELIIEEANIYYNKKNESKFKELLEEAVKIRPDDPVLYFNIGVMSLNQNDLENAEYNFNKAIELKPDYADAYHNLAITILKPELEIVEKMNENLNNFDKYDKLQAMQIELYKKALPYLEKSLELDSENINTIQTLIGVYENLEMYDKQKELKETLESINKKE